MTTSTGGALYFEGGIDPKKLYEEIGKINAQLKGMADNTQKQGERMDDVMRKVGTAMGAYFSLTTMSNFGKSVALVRGEFQQLEIALETMLKSKSEADMLMAQTIEFAASTPYELKDVGNGVKKLLAFNVAAEDSISTLRMLGDISAGLGTDLEGLVSAYGKVKSKGKLQAEEMNLFLERGVPLVRELAKQYGVAEMEIYKMAEAGKVRFADLENVLRSLTGQGGMFEGMMEKQSKSIIGLISNLSDAWTQMLNDMGKSEEGLITDTIKTAKALVENYKKVIDITKVLIATYGAYKAATITTSILNQAQAAGSLAKALRATAAAQTLLNIAQKANPAGLILAAITALIGGLWAYSRATKSVIGVNEEFKDSLKSEIDQLKEVFSQATKAADGTDDRKKAIDEINEKYGSYLKNLLNEKSSLEEIKKAQDETSKALAKSLALKAQEVDIEEFKAKTASKQKSYQTDVNDVIIGAKLDPTAAGKVGAELDMLVGKMKESLNFEESGNYSTVLRNINQILRENNIEMTLFGSGASVNSGNISDLVYSVIDLARANKNEETAINDLSTAYESYLKTLGLVNDESGNAADDAEKNSVKLKTVADRIKEIEDTITQLEKDRANLPFDDLLGIGKINEQIKKLNEEKDKLEGKVKGGKTIVKPGSYAALEEEIKSVTEALQNASKTETPILARRLLALQKEKQAWDKIIESINEKAPAMMKLTGSKQTVSTMNEQDFLNARSRVYQKKYVGEISSEAADAMIAELNKYQNKIQAQSKPAGLELDKLKKKIEENRRAAEKLKNEFDLTSDFDPQELAEGLFKAADAGSELARFVGTFNQEAAEAINKVSEIANGVGNIVAGYASGDPFQMIAGITQVATVIVEAVKGASEYEKIMMSINSLIELQNFQMERQLEIIDGLVGAGKIEATAKAIEQVNGDLEELQKKIEAGISVTGKKGNWWERLWGNGSNSSATAKGNIEDFIRTYEWIVKKEGEGFDFGNQKTDIKAIIDQYDALMEKRKELAAQLEEKLTGNTYQSLSDELASLFGSGKTASEDFADSLESNIKKAILNGFKIKFLESQFDELNKAFSSNLLDGLDQTDITTYTEGYNKIVENAKAGWEAITKATGVDFTSDSSGSGIAGQIQRSITEDTASELVGLWNRTALDIRENLVASKAALNNLVMIEANTFRTANNTDRLANMESSLRSIDSAVNKTAGRM